MAINFPRPSRFAALGAIAAAVCLCGTSSAQTPPAASPPVKVTLLTGTPQGSTATPVYWIGKPLGFQAENNIDGEVLTVPGGNVAQSAQFVLSGRADAALMSPDTILVPTAEGKDTGLVFVYNFYQHPSYRLLVGSDSGITTVVQLKGKPVGIAAPGNPAEPMLAAFLSDSGLTLADVAVQPVGVDIAAAQALKSGRISALLGVAPAWAVWDAAGYSFTALPSPKIFGQLIGSGVAVARTSLQDPAKRDALARLLRTWAELTVFVKAAPKAAIELDFAMFPQAKPRNLSDAEALEQGMRAQAIVVGDYATNVDGKWGAYRPDAFRDYVKYLGLSDKMSDIDSLWSNQLVDEINAFDEKAILQKAAQSH